MKALILCAGAGERLKPITEVTPKPLLEVGGKPIIDYVVENLFIGGVTDICLNLYWLADKMLMAMGSAYHYSLEPYPLGTAGAIRYAKAFFDGEQTFVVCNGDTITNVNIKEMLNSHLESGKIMTVFTKDTAIHNGGTFIFEREVLDFIPAEVPYSIHEDLIPQLFCINQVNEYKPEDAFYYDCGTIEKLLKVRKVYEEGTNNLSSVREGGENGGFGIVDAGRRPVNRAVSSSRN